MSLSNLPPLLLLEVSEPASELTSESYSSLLDVVVVVVVWCLESWVVVSELVGDRRSALPIEISTLFKLR